MFVRTKKLFYLYIVLRRVRVWTERFERVDSALPDILLIKNHSKQRFFDPLILNIPHHIKHRIIFYPIILNKKRETKLIIPLHIKHFIITLSHKLQSLPLVLNTSFRI